ncbi:transcription-repair-coupling factor [Spirochaetia bacterium]|nr:transcription-repair-coupling factor [Spirochaetia bacterium]
MKNSTSSLPDIAGIVASSPEILQAVQSFYKEESLEIIGAQGALSAFIIASVYKKQPHPLLLVVSTDRDALILEADLKTLNVDCSILPWWGTIPYRETPENAAVFAERAEILCKLAHLDAACEPPVIIVNLRAFLTPAPPPEYLKGLSKTLIKGATLDLIALGATLTSWGYTRVHRVQMTGEFVLRGELMDVMTASGAFRIRLDFDKIESIKSFDIEDLKTTQQFDSLTISPLKELIWDDKRIEVLSANLSTFNEFSDTGNKGGDNGGKEIIEQLITTGKLSGQELYFSLAFEKPSNILEYFPVDKTVIFLERERLATASQSLITEYTNLFRSALREKKVPSPARLLLDFDDTVRQTKKSISFFSVRTFTTENSKSVDVNVNRHDLNCENARNFLGNINYMKEEFSALLEQDWKIVVACESEAQTNRLKEIINNSSSDKAKNINVPVITASLSSGFGLPSIKFLLVQEKDIFGHKTRRPHSLTTVKSAAIDTFVELTPGDYVVHINYGIGLFKGIDRIKALNYERDYIKLEYSGEEIIFVPIEQVNLVQRYIGNEGAAPRLDTIGSKSWSERRAHAKKCAQELAAHLIGIYSKRKAAKGFAFPKDTEWQTMFEADFSFEETPDQLRCVEEIKTDMESTSPMDRLICGDVGYGKTEVAIRACFKAVMGGKQAAFLAPTTILSEQHYQTFKDRFKNYPVSIAQLSRFIPQREAKKTVEKVKNGEIDILIGTHRIIQKDIMFKDLGLMVVDEEQRFGVKDKERLKLLKHNVDSLALSATPIPRTLHMSLLKIRDMSTLATPPVDRLPIETFVDEYDEEKVAKAIRAEIARGGQIFYLHNRIETLEDMCIKLQQLVPEALIEYAHGRMMATELEDIMLKFISGGFNVLVSTTIIENGIDIPNVNTIIIDRADMFGVSQLYQLRGRVGRSDKTAYAYLFYPENSALSELAMRRLNALSSFTELGSGFKIAMKDMEIRGAGNLLGREQSGAIYSVGFDLYMRLLDEAIQNLQNENWESEIETVLELEYTGFIPASYIDNAEEKMEIYKKIAAVKVKDDLEGLEYEIYDRFGPPPIELISLLSLAEIKIICRRISIASLKERSGIVRIEFSKVGKINVDRIVRLIQESAGRIKIDPKQPNVITMVTGHIELKEKSDFIKEKLSFLL